MRIQKTWKFKKEHLFPPLYGGEEVLLFIVSFLQDKLSIGSSIIHTRQRFEHGNRLLPGLSHG